MMRHLRYNAPAQPSVNPSVGSISGGVVVGVLVVFALHYAYRTESAVAVLAVVLAILANAIIYHLLRKGRAQPALIALVILMLFAPPTIIFDSPVTIGGTKLLPVYLAMAVLPPYFLYRRGVNLEITTAVRFLFPLVIATLMQFPVIALYGWPGDAVEVSAKASTLLVVLALSLSIAASAVLSELSGKSALSLILLILGLQLYQSWVFLLHHNVDPFLWFGSDHWLRFGQGYSGEGFNPVRMYAFFWDPNYLICVLTPLYFKARELTRTRMQGLALSACFAAVIAATLSYQSFIVAMMVLFWARLPQKQSLRLRAVAFGGALLLPVALILFALIVPASALPPSQNASLFERLHIMWSVSQAIVTYPMGVGVGLFEPLALKHAFSYSLDKSMPPHGWLFEIMTNFGLVWYYVLVLALAFAIRKTSKAANIAVVGLLFWGITSPALGTPYFWVSLGFAISLSCTQVRFPERVSKRTVPALQPRFSSRPI